MLFNIVFIQLALFLSWALGDYLPTEDPYIVSGIIDGPNHYQYGSNFAAIVTKLQLYFGDNGTNGAYMEFQDGGSHSIGSLTGKSSELKLAQDETVTDVTMWPTADGESLNKIRISTSKGTEFSAGTGMDVDSPAINVDVGSGIPAGVELWWTREGKASRFALCFWKPIDYFVIGDMVYDPDPTGTLTNLDMTDLDSATFVGSDGNNDGGKQQWTFANSKQVTDSSTFTTSLSSTFGLKTTVKGGVPAVAEATEEVSWSITASLGWSTTHSETVGYTYSLSGSIDPDEVVSCKASLWKGQLDISVTANRYWYFVDKSLEPKADAWKGNYQGVSTAWANVQCDSNTKGKQTYQYNANGGLLQASGAGLTNGTAVMTRTVLSDSDN